MDARTRWASYAASRTRAKLEQRRRQGERWRLADMRVMEEVGERVLGVAEAWRRWQNEPLALALEDD